MAKFTGTIRHNDLEGGFNELVTDAGDVYRLEGGHNQDLEDGKRVCVHGNLEEPGGFGIHMTGTPAIKVTKIEPA